MNFPTFSLPTKVSRQVYLSRIMGVAIRTSSLRLLLQECNERFCWSQWTRGLRRRSAAARLLRLWVRIPPGTWMFVCCECCVMSGRGLCDKIITCPKKSYRLWCVRSRSLVNEALSHWGLLRQKQKKMKGFTDSSTL